MADSLGLRRFLRIGLNEGTPDHSTISRTRRRLDLETHRAVFTWVLGVLADRGLLQGQRLGIDATTLEANTALRSIVRRDTGETYEEFLRGLAQPSGIETPTREELARLDRKRKKKASNQDWSNQDWKSPADEDARIAKMKEGSTHLAHKAEHAVDLDTRAVAAVADLLARAAELRPEAAPQVNAEGIEELVTDKGYHSGAVVERVQGHGVTSNIPEKQQAGRRHWVGKRAEQQAVYANRRRIRSAYGKILLRRRGELIKRSFAHCYETGGMRRCYLRGRENILKRQLVHVGAFNLSLILRGLLGAGTPRELKNRAGRALSRLLRVLRAGAAAGPVGRRTAAAGEQIASYFRCRMLRYCVRIFCGFATGC